MKHSMMRIPEKCLVAVCDGGQALVLRNRGSASDPNLITIWAASNQGKLTHELGTDRPGRVMPRFGTARSAVEQTDLHEKAETDLLKSMMSRLAQAIRMKEANEIIIVAPASALGWMRGHMPKAVEQAIVGELSKDLAHCPVEDIQRHLVEWALAWNLSR